VGLIFGICWRATESKIVSWISWANVVQDQKEEGEKHPLPQKSFTGGGDSYYANRK